MQVLNNTRICDQQTLLQPSALMAALPITTKMALQVDHYRQQIADILHGRCQRQLLIVGPCSIHDTAATIDYAERLSAVASQVSDVVLILMRVYFDKPRTTLGWTGFINDPSLDGRNDINAGLHKARRLLLALNQLDMPVATEFLDTMIPQYIGDLVAWAAIGARTTESQLHRHMASGLSMPIGFKNGTTGDIQVAVDAVLAASHAHTFLGDHRSWLSCNIEYNR